MRQHARRWAMVAVAAALVGVAMAGGAVAGGFEKKPIDQALLSNPDVVRGGYRFVQLMTDPIFDTLPEGVEHKVKYGRVALGEGEPLAFVVSASRADGPVDTLHVDVKRSGNLAEGAVVRDIQANMQSEIALTLADGETEKLEIVLTDSYLLVQSEPAWWLGTVEIDGQSHMAALVDRDQDGTLQAGGSDLLLIDLDKSGVFESDPDGGNLGEATILQSEVMLRGKLYDAAIDKEKIDLQLTPYRGPLGWLALETRLKQTPRSFLFNTYYLTSGEEQNNYRYVFGDSASFPLPFKPAKLERMIGIMQFQFETGGPMIMQFEIREPLAFQADTTTTLAIGAHDPLAVTVTQVNGQLQVAQSLSGPGGIVYQRIQQIPDPKQATDGEGDSVAEMVELANMGPQVTILDSDGKVLAEGSMEYG